MSDTGHQMLVIDKISLYGWSLAKSYSRVGFWEQFHIVEAVTNLDVSVSNVIRYIQSMKGNNNYNTVTLNGCKGVRLQTNTPII